MLKQSHLGKALPTAWIASLLISGLLPPVALASDYNLNAAPEVEEPIPLPSRRTGGGTRRETCARQDSLVALIPEHSVGITTSPHPTLFLHFPRSDRPQAVEFVLRNQDDKLVYDSVFSTSGEAGVRGIELPRTSNPLALNQIYHWYVSIICDPNNRAQDIVVEGFIQRVELDRASTQRLKRMNPLEKVDFYQDANVWYEALTTLARAKDTQASKAIVAKWVELLQSVGLATVAQEPLLDSGSISKRRSTSVSSLPRPRISSLPAQHFEKGSVEYPLYQDKAGTLIR